MESYEEDTSHLDAFEVQFRILWELPDSELKLINILEEQKKVTTYLLKKLEFRLIAINKKFYTRLVIFSLIFILTILLHNYLLNIYVNIANTAIKNQERNAKLALIGELTSSIGHEMATPLQVLLLASNKLKKILNEECTDTKKIKQNIDSVDKMANLIMQINKTIRSLTLSRNENNQNERVSVQKVIEDVKLITEGYAFKYNAEIEFESFQGNSFCMGKDYEIIQILTNLIKNGLDASKDSQIKKIKFSVSQNSNETIFLVADSGTGINDDLKQRIFEPLFTTKLDFGGTGLGLSISTKLANGMEGSLKLESGHNEFGGATFILILKSMA